MCGADAGSDEWNEPLFQCCNEPISCMCSFFCPCYQAGENINKFNHVVQGESDDGVCIHIFMYMILFPCLSPLFHCQTLGQLRMLHDLKGDQCTDCAESWFCHCCSLSQTYREMLSRYPDVNRDRSLPGGSTSQSSSKSTNTDASSPVVPVMNTSQYQAPSAHQPHQPHQEPGLVSGAAFNPFGN